MLCGSILAPAALSTHADEHLPSHATAAPSAFVPLLRREDLRVPLLQLRRLPLNRDIFSPRIPNINALGSLPHNRPRTVRLNESDIRRFIIAQQFENLASSHWLLKRHAFPAARSLCAVALENGLARRPR